MIKYSFSICCILIAFSLIGQSYELKEDGIQELREKKFENASFIYEDSFGWIWIGTSNGLFLYDGHAILDFKDNANDNSEYNDFFFNANVQSPFFEDEENDIWFTTYDELNRYDRINGEFEHFQLKDSCSQIIEGNYRLTYIENEKNLILRVGNKLCHYNSVTDESIVLDSTLSFRYGFETDHEDKLKFIYASPWAIEEGLEVFEFNGVNEFVKRDHILKELNGNKLTFMNLEIALNGENNFFTSQGLIQLEHLNPYGNVIRNSDSRNTQKFRNGLSLNDSLLILSSSKNGLLLYDNCMKSFIDSSDVAWHSALMKVNQPVDDIYLDGSKNIWVSFLNNKPIQFFSTIPNKFKYPFAENGKENVIVNSFVEDEEGDLWFATEYNGLYIFDSELSLKNTQDYEFESGINQILKMPTKEIFGVTDHSVVKLNKNDLTKEEKFRIDRPSLFYTIPLSESRQWIFTSEGILELYDFTADNCNEFEKTNNPTLELSVKIGNKIYILNYRNEVAIYEFDKFSEEIIKKDTLRFPTAVNTVAEINNGKLWFGCGNGIWEDSSGIIKQVEIINHDFKEASIVGIMFERSKDRVWLATNEGLLLKFLSSGKEYCFRVEDGLPSNIFLKQGHGILSDGRICFNSDNGPVIFDPDEVKPNPYESQIIIHSISDADGVAYDTMNPNVVPHYNLDYFQNYLKIKATASGFYHNKLNTIKYRLKNRHDEWRYKKNGDEILYGNLEPGQYALEINGINANGVFGPMRTISFDIRPPWWSSWWFILAVIGAIGSIFGLIVREYYKRQLRRQQIIIEKQQALQEERSRIASELHDDLGSNLSTIRFMSSLVNRQVRDNKVKVKLDQIFKTAGDLMEKMEDIIWANNPENDSLENLFIHIREYASQFLENHELGYNIELPNDAPDLVLGGEKRRNILLIIKEVLNNIIKHAKADKVIIQALVQDESLYLKIIDDGVGLPKDIDMQKGNGLSNIKKRMKSLGGEVHFETKLSKGAQVSIRIPFK